MIDLYVFRHGETDWNLLDKIQGQTDIPLNETGKIQAKELGQRLQTLKLEIILSSPLLRAKETAEIANQQLGVPIVYAPELKEASLGTIEGMTLKELYSIYGKEYFFRWRSSLRNDDEINFPEAEPKNEIRERVVSYLINFCRANNYRRIGISTHGFLIRRLLSHIDENLPKDGKMPNVSIWHIKLDQNLTMQLIKTT